MDSISGTAVHEDRAVVVGEAGASAQRLVVVDAATGDLIWTVDSGQELFGGKGVAVDDGGFVSPMEEPVLTGTGPGWSVVVPYQREVDDGFEFGMAALSGETGKVRWQYPVRTDDHDFTTEWSTPLVATEDTVWMTTMENGFGSIDAPVVAVDAKDGTELWSRRLSVAPYLVDDGTILAEKVGAYTKGGPADSTGVVALDGRTGDTLWDLNDRYPDASLEAVMPTTAVIKFDDPDSFGDKFVAVDTGTGEQVAELGRGHGSCVTDGASGIACPLDDGRMTSIVADRSVVTTDPERIGDFDPELTGLFDGRLLASAPGDNAASKQYVLDPDGEVLAADPPGRLLGGGDGFALFGTSDDLSGSSDVGLYRVVTA